MFHAFLYMTIAATHLAHLTPIGHSAAASTCLIWVAALCYMLAAIASLRECRVVRRWFMRGRQRLHRG